MRIYQSREIQKLTGASKIQISHWCNVGAVIPHEDDARRGGVRKFNEQNLIEFHVCKRLADFQISAHNIKLALDTLRKQWVKENKKYIPWERLQETFDKVDWFLIALPERVTARQTITSLKSHRHPNPNSEKKRKQLLNEIEEASKHTPVDNIGFVFADDVDFYLKLFDAMIIINLSEIVREVRA